MDFIRVRQSSLREVLIDPCSPNRDTGEAPAFFTLTGRAIVTPKVGAVQKNEFKILWPENKVFCFEDRSVQGAAGHLNGS